MSQSFQIIVTKLRKKQFLFADSLGVQGRKVNVTGTDGCQQVFLIHTSFFGIFKWCDCCDMGNVNTSKANGTSFPCNKLGGVGGLGFKTHGCICNLEVQNRKKKKKCKCFWIFCKPNVLYSECSLIEDLKIFHHYPIEGFNGKGKINFILTIKKLC